MTTISISTDMYDSSIGQFVQITEDVQSVDDTASRSSDTTCSGSDTSALGDSIPWISPESS